MTIRYINASDVSKLLGPEYDVYWSTKAENLNIINNIREKYQPNKPITFELNTKTIETIQTLEPVEITAIVNTIQAPEELERTQSLTAKDLRIILELPTTNRSKKEVLVEQYNKKIVIESLNKTKKETVVLNTHVEYSSKTAKVLAQIVHPVLKAVLDTDFTMERGNVEEEKIIKEFNIKKDNKFRSCSFKVGEQGYKVGCRFDGENVEIKTRKTKFLGVPIYEKVQMHFYMATSCVTEWTLKEKYSDKVQDHLVQFDNAFFEKVKLDLHKSWESLISQNIRSPIGDVCL